MKLGIIGKPQSGKTTIFNAAGAQHQAVGDFSQAVHRAVIKVPDPRLEALAELVHPKKITQAEVELLDAPGLSGKGKEAAGLEISQDLRQMDAFLLVVDAFSTDAKPEADIRNAISTSGNARPG
jgi:ribosome-binding ATPase YchF (GTP1/OBG family)